MLNEMYNFLADESPVKFFIKNNCSHLLLPSKGHTGYPKEYFEAENFISHSNVNSLPISYSKSITEFLDNKAGVYTFFSFKTKKFYIGATTDFFVRFMNHYHGVDTNSNRLLYQEVKNLGGFHNFLWQPTSVSPNYYLKFIRENLELSKDYLTYRILTSFTQYETRLLEQAFKSFIKPELNGEGDVTFLVNWDPKDIRESLLGSRPFKAITKEGSIYEFSSLNHGQAVLGRSRKTIETLMNYPNNYTYCPGVNMECRFYEEGRPLKENSPYTNQYLRSDFEGIDYNSLPLNKIIAFDKNFNVIADFNSSKEAAAECGLGSYYRVSRHINKMFIKEKYVGKEVELLFAQNPLSKGSSKKVVLFNLNTKTSLLFSSFNDLVRYFDLNPKTQGGNSPLRKCLLKGEPYKECFKIFNLEGYEGPKPIPYDEDKS
uniref:GIY-YIG endonuclease n=1 Tax=Sphaerobolus stellatus TaxID=68786 RepID=A0A7D4ZF17_9AGAM|nr:GIY-YIG endonuclease [Sphaerobolus stellatus]